MNDTSMLLPTQEYIDYLCKGVQDFKDASESLLASPDSLCFLANAGKIVYFQLLSISDVTACSQVHS